MIERDLILIGDQAWTPEEREAYRNRREREYERARMRRATDPEYRERYNASKREWRARNRDRYNAYMREWMRQRRAA